MQKKNSFISDLNSLFPPDLAMSRKFGNIKKMAAGNCTDEDDCSSAKTSSVNATPLTVVVNQAQKRSKKKAAHDVSHSAVQHVGDSDSDDPLSGKIEINMNQSFAEMSMKTGSNISHNYTYFGELVKQDKLYLLHLCEKDIFTGVSLAEVGEKVPLCALCFFRRIDESLFFLLS